MSINKFLLNLSILGERSTGLGHYSQYCAACLERHFNCELLASHYQSTYDSPIIQSPQNIAIGAGRWAALRRIFYSYKSFPRKDAFIYNPTHHGVFGWSNQVVTILDLISIHHPFQHKFQYAYFKWLLPKILNQCQAVFVISETTKADFCNYNSFKEENVYVIPCGVDTKRFHRLEGTNEKEPFLLCVGASYPHKNVEELLLNWPLWKNKYQVKIVSGGKKHEQKLRHLVKELDLLTEVTFLGYVSDDELVTLYNQCSALVTPSLWEGFGLTPLEAMACGSQVIVSDIPVHQEILTKAAIYITPGQQETWITAFKMLENDTFVSQKKKAAQEVVKRYSWETSCDTLVNALLSVEPELARFRKKG